MKIELDKLIKTKQQNLERLVQASRYINLNIKRERKDLKKLLRIGSEQEKEIGIG